MHSTDGDAGPRPRLRPRNRPARPEAERRPSPARRFAFETRRHHAFSSTGNAYDASQCDESIKTGDTLIVLAEQVVAIASPKPFAVTETCGKLHALAPPRPGESLTDLARSLHVGVADFQYAADLACRLGLPPDPQLALLLAGASDVD